MVVEERILPVQRFEMDPEIEFDAEDEELFAATARGLATMGLTKVIVTLPAYLRDGHPEECYIAARRMLVEKLAFKPGHEYLKIEAGRIFPNEVHFIVEGLTGGCRCHMAQRTEPQFRLL